MLARVLVAPAFLYRVEDAGRGRAVARVRLGASQPPELLPLVVGPRRRSPRPAPPPAVCDQPDVLAAGGRRMLRPTGSARLATEFACQWLTSTTSTPSTRRASGTSRRSTASAARCTRRRSASSPTCSSATGRARVLDADSTFLNGPLGRALRHPRRRRDRVAAGRGGQGVRPGRHPRAATTLAKQSGASRTSPILRGNWVSEVLLGEKLPKPPPDVPALPDDEAADRRPDRPPARRAAHPRSEQMRRLPRADRPDRLRPSKGTTPSAAAATRTSATVPSIGRPSCSTVPRSTGWSTCARIC